MYRVGLDDEGLAGSGAQSVDAHQLVAVVIEHSAYEWQI